MTFFHAVFFPRLACFSNNHLEGNTFPSGSFETRLQTLYLLLPKILPFSPCSSEMPSTTDNSHATKRVGTGSGKV